MWIVQWFPLLPSSCSLNLGIPRESAMGNKCNTERAVRSHLSVSELGIDNSVNTALIAHNTAQLPMAF